MTNDHKTRLCLKDVCVNYGDHDAISHTSLDFNPGSLVGLIGANGAGKTTLLKAATGLVRRSSGEVFINDRLLESWPRAERARRLGYLSQDRSVLWPLSVERLVSLGRLPHLGPWDAITSADQNIIHQALKDADVAHLASRPVTSLSGGERTRALIARLLAGSPSILLADEPVSGLDPAHRLQVLQIFRKMARADKTVIVVMHDLSLAARFCDRLILLSEGCVAADGSPEHVLTSENLSKHYGVTANITTHNGELLVMPWTLEDSHHTHT